MTDAKVIEMADSLIMESSVWFSRFDRNVLGKFAVDAPLLNIKNAIDTAHYYKNMPLEDPLWTDVYKLLIKMDNDFIMTDIQPLDNFSVEAEICLWKEVDGESEDLTISDQVLDRLYFLRKVYAITKNNLAAVPYVEVGIMDVDVIQNCIRNDIDPAMVHTLLGVG